MSNREIISYDAERQALLDRIKAARDFANGDHAIGYVEFISGQEASAENISDRCKRVILIDKHIIRSMLPCLYGVCSSRCT